MNATHCSIDEKQGAAASHLSIIQEVAYICVEFTLDVIPTFLLCESGQFL